MTAVVLDVPSAPRGQRASNRNQRKRRAARRRLPMLLRRQGNRCYYCGRHIVMPKDARSRDEMATVEHHLALADGGDNRERNLVAACDQCNHHRGSERDKTMCLECGGQIDNHAVRCPWWEGKVE